MRLHFFRPHCVISPSQWVPNRPCALSDGSAPCMYRMTQEICILIHLLPNLEIKFYFFWTKIT